MATTPLWIATCTEAMPVLARIQSGVVATALQKKSMSKLKSTEHQAPIASRRYARERVMQTLYASLISPSDENFLCHTFIVLDEKLDDPGKVFAEDLFKQTVKHRTECEAILKDKSAHWDVARLAMIDRAILHMAIVELKYFRDIPPKVTIDEAIEIAKRFSTAESGKFVNGILDAVLDDLKADGTLNKRGRGLRSE